MQLLPIRFSIVLAVCVLLAACATGPSQTGWVALIDEERGLENWNRIGNANWHADEGAIVADAGSGGFLVSPRSYRDFTLRAEFWAEESTNSGIFVRASDPANITQGNAYEINIYDRRPDPSYGTGAIVEHARVAPMPKAAGRWNTYEISARGSEIIVVLNGVETARIESDRFAQGPIALQYGSGPEGAQGGVIRWRKVEIRE